MSVLSHTTLHRQAMTIYEKGLSIKRKDESFARVLFKQAFEIEREAANLLKEHVHVEPTRSVLYRSAGWMAYNAGMFKEAHEMAVQGKRFAEHAEMKEELEDLFQLAYEKIK